MNRITPSAEELRAQWEREHPFAPAGTAPDFSQMAEVLARGVTEAPTQAAQPTEEFERAHPFAPSGWAPKPAAEAVANLTRASAARAADLTTPATLENLHARVLQLEAEIRRLHEEGGGGGGGGTVNLPFELVEVDTENVLVRPGLVRAVAATGTGSNVDLSGESDGTYLFYIEATLNAAGEVTAAAVEYASSVPADDHSTAHWRIGRATVASGVLTSVVSERPMSKDFVACDRDPEDHETTPGRYQWGVA